MIDSIYQNDLFHANNSAEKKRPRFRKSYPTQRFLPYVRIPVEYIVVLGVVMLMLVVMAYAAGIERGMRHVPILDEETDVVSIEILTVPEAEPEEVFDEPGKAGAINEVVLPIVLEQETITVKTAQVEKEVAKPEEESYTVRLATFGKKGNAEIEASKLKEKGYDANLAKIGKWYQLYVRGFSNISVAREAQGLFASEYPDCYIRKQ